MSNRPGLPNVAVPITDPAWRRFFDEIRLRTPRTGTATFATATSVSVSLAPPEIDENYMVALDPPELNFYSVPAGSKVATSFSINATTSTSASVPWAIMRL